MIPASVVFQVPTGTSSPHTKEAYLGLVCPERLQSDFRVKYSAALQWF